MLKANTLKRCAHLGEEHGHRWPGAARRTYLRPNAHLLSWGSNAAFLATSGRSGAHTRELRALESIAPSTLDLATSVVDATGGKYSPFAGMDFYEASSKRCVLCGSILSGSYVAHASYVEHVARVGIVERAVALLLHHLDAPTATDDTHQLDRQRVDRWTAEEVVTWLDAHWWDHLHPGQDCDTPPHSPQDGMLAANLPSFNRLPTLSASNPHARMHRLRFLLGTLKDVGVLRFSLMGTVAPLPGSAGQRRATLDNRAASAPEDVGYARSDLFQRFEMIGDNVMKVLMPDRLQAMFPFAEGGVDARLQSIQRLLDSNQGLLDIYDALNLNALVGSYLANSKAKSDVVEAIFGELQTFLWAVDSQSAGSVECVPAGPSRSLQRIRVVTEHALNELMHVLMMWCVNEAVRNVFPLLASHILKPYGKQEASHRRLSAKHALQPSSRAVPTATMSDAYWERVQNRTRPQRSLPLLTKSSTPHYLSDTLHTHRDWFNHSATSAPKAASAQAQGPRQLDKIPSDTPRLWRQWHRANCARMVVAPQWTHTQLPHARERDALSLSSVRRPRPTISRTAAHALQLELVESYPWSAPNRQ